MKNLVLISFSLLLGLMPTFAQEQGKKCRKGHKKNPELKAALKTYHQKEMLPVLQAKHSAFDAKLNNEDLAFLTQKRQESKAMRVEHKSLRQQIKTAKAEGKTKEEVKEQFGTEREQMRNKKKALAESMQPFIKRNQDLITATENELKPNREKWNADRKAIREKYRPADAPSAEECKKKREEKAAKNPEKAEKRKLMRQEKKIMRFLLWDGEARSMEDVEQAGDNSTMGGLTQIKEAMELDNYPNPAKEQTTIQFSLPDAASQVNLTITTLEGKVVQQQQLGKRGAGKHSFDLDVRALANGQYFYTLEADKQKLSKTFMINR
ncbi:MAG: T9SS type A sorting domain-containing protein [Aureispira sp.]|nr:T9SS type A sorting domain-containing protein [Aureispira sp.]